jgi:hypothetical protein
VRERERKREKEKERGRGIERRRADHGSLFIIRASATERGERGSRSCCCMIWTGLTNIECKTDYFVNSSETYLCTVYKIVALAAKM